MMKKMTVVLIVIRAWEMCVKFMMRIGIMWWLQKEWITIRRQHSVEQLKHFRRCSNNEGCYICSPIVDEWHRDTSPLVENV